MLMLAWHVFPSACSTYDVWMMTSSLLMLMSAIWMPTHPLLTWLGWPNFDRIYISIRNFVWWVIYAVGNISTHTSRWCNFHWVLRILNFFPFLYLVRPFWDSWVASTNSDLSLVFSGFFLDHTGIEGFPMHLSYFNGRPIMWSKKQSIQLFKSYLYGVK
jgi:hypothetical protein